MENNEPITPITKILNKLLSSEPFSQKPIVMVSDGSYNPPHKAHLHIFEAAKKYIEEKMKRKVVGGLFSPSCDSYLRNKFKESINDAINSEHRIEMLKLITKDSEWIGVDIKGATFPNPEALTKLDDLNDCLNSNKKIKKILEHCEGIEIIYVCGSDLVKRDLLNEIIIEGNYEYKIIVVGREEDENWESECKNHLDLTFGITQWKKHIFFVDSLINKDISSTKARNIIKGTEEGNLADCLTSEVIKYIKENQLYISKEESNYYGVY